MQAELYNMEKAAPPGSNLYYSTLFHPPQQKRSLYALFALQQELSDTVIECQDAGVAHSKLHWWREEIARLTAGCARHPVSRELQALMPDLALDPDKLERLVDIFENDIQPPQAESLQQLVEQRSAGRGLIWQLAALACDCRDHRTLAEVARTGGLVSCVTYFQQAGQYLQRGFCPYPSVELQTHGLAQQDLLTTTKRAELSRMQVEIFTVIESALAHSLKTPGKDDRPAVLFALTMARIGAATCSLLKKNTGDIPRRPLSINPLRKLWIAWRTKMQM